MRKSLFANHLIAPRILARNHKRALGKQTEIAASDVHSILMEVRAQEFRVFVGVS
jgi:hypothetical protein